MIYVSGNEPSVIKVLLKQSIKIQESTNETESYGADFTWETPFGRAGIQRKEFPNDFLASSKYGERLAKEVLQMEAGLKWRMLILEAKDKPKWGADGNLLGQYKGGLHIDHLEAMLESMDYFRGIRIRWSDGHSDTVRKILRFHKWTTKKNHTGFCANRESHPELKEEDPAKMKVSWIEWVLMGFPGISSTLAKRIIELEPEPLAWVANLDKVPGIGKVKAKTLYEALQAPPK